MQINKEQIEEILERSQTAEDFKTYAACRERNVRDGVSRLSAIRMQMAKEGFNPIPQDLLSMFRDLERAGVGTLKEDSFKWNVPIKYIASVLKDAAPKKVNRPHFSRKRMVMVLGINKEIDLEFTPNLSKEDVHIILEKLLQECQ